MNSTTRIGGIAIVSGILLLVFMAFFFIFWPNFNKSTIELKLGSGDFKASLAVNELQRADGLSKVKDMASDEALIMAYPYEYRWKIWMKDMNFPIDIIWLDSNKKVICIVKNADPADSTNKTFEPKDVAKYVIEVPAGTVKDEFINIDQIADFNIDETDIK